eukprot:CAMPEP_0171983268 /NCGR_PEP_ID=MMETSP0993-20121228/273207_1 /TAXON_ID=483369 /ORGANISM="non described non described, Strain CCMP2098" /LENGTH=367 /DNA_ID=CAMNT_0012636021 /DNA_START=152 /DNA_END=1256 /DNA_ORIENTATION=+
MALLLASAIIGYCMGLDDPSAPNGRDPDSPSIVEWWINIISGGGDSKRSFSDDSSLTTDRHSYDEVAPIQIKVAGGQVPNSPSLEPEESAVPPSPPSPEEPERVRLRSIGSVVLDAMENKVLDDLGEGITLEAAAPGTTAEPETAAPEKTAAPKVVAPPGVSPSPKSARNSKASFKSTRSNSSTSFDKSVTAAPEKTAAPKVVAPPGVSPSPMSARNSKGSFKSSKSNSSTSFDKSVNKPPPRGSSKKSPKSEAFSTTSSQGSSHSTENRKGYLDRTGQITEGNEDVGKKRVTENNEDVGQFDQLNIDLRSKNLLSCLTHNPGENAARRVVAPNSPSFQIERELTQPHIAEMPLLWGTSGQLGACAA